MYLCLSVPLKTMGRIVRTWSIWLPLIFTLISTRETATAMPQPVDFMSACGQEIPVAEEDPAKVTIFGDKWTSGNSCILIFAATEVEDDLYLRFQEYNVSHVCDTVSFSVDTRSKYIFYSKKTIYGCEYTPFVGPIADRWERYTRLTVTRNSTEDTAFRIVFEVTTYDVPDIVFPTRKMSITEGTIAAVVIGVVGFIIIVGVIAFIVALAKTKKENKPPRSPVHEPHPDSGMDGDML